MDFLNPYLLWGVLGITIPIIIHLLNRFRYRQIDWAAMELLRRALIARSHRLRIEDLLLLFLRCLAILLLALGFARLTLTPSGAGLMGGKADVGAVVAMDGSFSMAHRPGIRSRMDGAIDRAREIFGILPRSQPLSLILMGSRPRLLLRNIDFEKARTEEALRGVEPLPERLDLEASLEEVKTLLQETKAPVRECYLITDAQRNSWENLSDRARKTLEEIGSLSKIFVLPAPVESAENLAITRFRLASGVLRTGATARFAARVQNPGEAKREGVAVSLLVDETAVDQRVLDRIDPGQEVDVPLFARFTRAGCNRLTARLEDDPLLIDNNRHAVCEVRDQVRILCVDGDPSPVIYNSETGYLSTALAACDSGEGEKQVFINAIPWLELSTQRLSDYDIVILANLPDVQPEQTAALYKFVKNGGGLMVFLGANVQPELLNERMRYEDGDLLPGRVLEARGELSGSGNGFAIQPAAADHPLCRAIQSLEPELIDGARIFRHFGIELGGERRPVRRLAGDGTPYLSERDLGQGKVLLFASTADREWTDIVSNPIYPIILQQAVTYLTRRSHEKPLIVSQPIFLPLPASLLSLPGDTGEANTVECLQPGEEKGITIPITWSEGEPAVEFAGSGMPGFCTVRAGSGPPLHVAANVDAAESDVKCLAGDALPAVFAGLNVRLVPPGDDLLAAVKEYRIGRELWWELILAGLLILFIESYLAHRFSRRAREGSGK